MATYSSWSLDRLLKEKDKIEKAIENKESRDRKAAIAKINAVAKQSGFELSELLDGAAAPKKRGRPAGTAVKKAAGKKRGKVAPKYRNPNNKTETWTGRGRQPVWVREHLKSGGKMDDVKI